MGVYFNLNAWHLVWLRIFTKLLKVVAAFLRKQGIRLVVYLDDFLIMNESEEGARADFKSALDILEFLGFLINWEKSITIQLISWNIWG